jgi:hypothetical protein
LTLIAQLSDPHVDVGPDDAGSAQALGAAVDAVLALEPLRTRWWSAAT